MPFGHFCWCVLVTYRAFVCERQPCICPLDLSKVGVRLTPAVSSYAAAPPPTTTTTATAAAMAAPCLKRTSTPSPRNCYGNPWLARAPQLPSQAMRRRGPGLGARAAPALPLCPLPAHSRRSLKELRRQRHNRTSHVLPQSPRSSLSLPGSTRGYGRPVRLTFITTMRSCRSRFLIRGSGRGG